MKFFSALLIFFSLFYFSLSAQTPWATQVIDYQFGLGQTIGQGSSYFPNNVLGAVNPNVSPTTPASSPDEVVSLGRNGWLILGFDSPIIDGLGADFTVFENVFEYPGGVFDEWLIVSVSNDGMNWFTIPYDSITGIGMAGRTPTQGGGNVNYQDSSQSGGDSFDIGQFGLSQIQYVKLQDATRFQSSDRISAEVDAVIAIHQKTTDIQSYENQYFELINKNTSLSIFAKEATEFILTDLQGKRIQQIDFGAGERDENVAENLPEGLYFWTCTNKKGQMQSGKWLKLALY